VTNADITSFRPNKRYDLILSISTFEHIGLMMKRRANRRIRFCRHRDVPRATRAGWTIGDYGAD
jgi:hypothetical protein